MKKPREIAWHVLLRREAQTDYVETLLAEEFERNQVPRVDRALAQELVYGVVRWQGALDWLIARKTQDRTQRPGLQILLRLGLYQIFWLDRVPDHAAVNETVEMAKGLGFRSQAGFVNAVLRNFLREHDATVQLLGELKLKQPHAGWSHPEWLVERWRARWGGDVLQQLLAFNNAPPRTYARLNTLKVRDAAAFLERWRMEDNVTYDFTHFDWVPENLVFELKDHPPLAGLGTFRDGSFYVQDPSTLLAVMMLDPKPGETILDLCAAPGGKTTFIAQQMNNEGRVLATDSVPDRLRLIRENTARLGTTCVEAAVDSVLENSHPDFDRILIDAPCSNTGVLRRRVDLRWRIRREEIDRLRATQLDLLRRAAPLLKPGGTMVFSTCSLEPEENTGVVQEFLAGHNAFTLDAEREFLPWRDAVDGAYVARLRKA